MEQQEDDLIYNAALYMRFSSDDGLVTDNPSITTQKMMLEKYCMDNGFKIYDSYVDDGYTGLNFDRPSFRRMIDDIERGNVNMVITKDLSRLGRDYIQTGYYSEVYFREKDIRYIAINDDYDSSKADNDIAPFKNILNNMYSRDLSKKVKSAIRQRISNGLYFASQAPYGYKKDPDNKNRLIIDEEAAENVREIFRLLLNGKGFVAVTKIMTEREILSPSAYKSRNGDKRYLWYHKGKDVCPTKWNISAVDKISKDRVYCGDTVGCKSEISIIGTKKIRLTPDKHIIVENTHEPIISREDFERVQILVKARHSPARHNLKNCFKGIIFCGQCGNRMHITTIEKLAVKTNADKVLFRCLKHSVNPTECPTTNYIYDKDLRAHVWASVKRVLKQIGSDEITIKTVLKKIGVQNATEGLNAERVKIEKRLNVLAVITRKLYEDYADGTMDEEGYRSLLKDYMQEKKLLVDRMTAISAECGKSDDKEASLRKLKLIAKEYADCAELTAEIVQKLVSRIEVLRVADDDGKVTNRINIFYRFVDAEL